MGVKKSLVRGVKKTHVMG